MSSNEKRPRWLLGEYALALVPVFVVLLVLSRFGFGGPECMWVLGDYQLEISYANATLSFGDVSAFAKAIDADPQWTAYVNGHAVNSTGATDITIEFTAPGFQGRWYSSGSLVLFAPNGQAARPAKIQIEALGPEKGPNASADERQLGQAVFEQAQWIEAKAAAFFGGAHLSGAAMHVEFGDCCPTC